MGIVACVAMLVPGSVVGWIAAVIYRFMLSGILSSSFLPEFIKTVGLQWFPSLVFGMVTGAVALALTMRLIKNAEPRIIAFAIATAWISLTLFASWIVVAVYDLPFDAVAGTAHTLGLVFGLGSVAKGHGPRDI